MSTALILAADDLSGACELAGAYAEVLGEDFKPGTLEVQLVPQSTDLPLHTDTEITVFDLDSRKRSGAEITRLTHSIGLDDLASGVQGFLKLDSLLRGAMADHIGALAQKRTVVFCPAVPKIDRTVKDGILYVAGQKLSETNLWSAEKSKAPNQIADLFVGSETVQLLVASYDSATELAKHLSTISRPGLIVIANCKSSAELRLLAAACAASENVMPVGSAEFGAAFAHHVVPSLAGAAPVVLPKKSAGGTAVVVVGSISDAAKSQVKFLREIGGLVLGAKELRELADQSQLDPGQRLVINASTKAIRDTDWRGDLLERIFATATARPLVLTGGATARAVLSELKLSRIYPLQSLGHGIVICKCEDGRLVGIKPGSFGDAATLHALASEIEEISTR